MKSCWALALGMLVWGCIATGPLFEDPGVPPEGYAQVVVYRVTALAAGAHSVPLQIDGTPVADLNMKGYTRVLLKPGVHSLNTLRGVKVVSGSTYYFRYESGSALAPPGLLTGEFALVADDVAKREIAGFHFQPAKIDKQNWNTSE